MGFEVGRQGGDQGREQDGHDREARLLTARAVLVGIDTGGTFTDLVAIVGGRLRVLKLRSTPRDPAAAVKA
ncbi:MAG TPA: hydantoinase/oxoprolinase N-terminal domain-containing protein, partial [Candidatus Binatia bacterium]|nr:hydantoinase/oxoprolinase N-terminal domain-containing protein [Candidatus Binatia bacterium]